MKTITQYSVQWQHVLPPTGSLRLCIFRLYGAIQMLLLLFIIILYYVLLMHNVQCDYLSVLIRDHVVHPDTFTFKGTSPT